VECRWRWLGDEFAFVLVVAGGKAGALVGGDIEAGVFHAKRVKMWSRSKSAAIAR